MPSGRLIRRIETFSDKEPVFDPSGSRMAVPNGDRAIEVWDVDQGVQVRPPIALPEQSAHVVAFQPDGHLAVRVGPSGQEPYRLVFIELTSGRQAGVMRLTGDIGTLNPEDQSVGLRSSSRDRPLNPADLRITAGGWRDALCAVLDRPFTPFERALLPPGADPTPPCS
jgi:WD40 repeat protein